MSCSLAGRLLFNIQMPVALLIGICGCDTLHGLPYEMDSVNKSQWPATYISAANDISNERCDEFVRKIVPLMSNGDNNAIYLMSQAMRKGLVLNEKTLSPATHLIDTRQANIDLLVFYAGLPDYGGKYTVFAETAQERLNLIQSLLITLGSTASTDQIITCYQISRPQDCYEHMVNIKAIPSLKHRVAELKKSYDARRLSATCRTGYTNIMVPF